MNKTELIDAIHAKINESRKMTKAEVALVFEGFLDAATEALAAGKEIKIAGFGAFRLSSRAERMGRNPNTGEAIKIPAHKEVRFKVGQPLKDAVNA